MEFYFKDLTITQVVEIIQEKLGGRELGKILFFDVVDETLEVTIKKMGKSVLKFDFAQKKDSLHFKLGHQKIAFSHRAFQGDVVSKLQDVISNSGGHVTHVDS